MDNDPLTSLLRSILPETIAVNEALVEDVVKRVNELSRVVAKALSSEPGVLDLYILLAKKGQYPLLVRGGLPIKNPVRLVEWASQALVPLARHGLYDNVARFSEKAGRDPLLVYDATRLYSLNRVSEVDEIARRRGLEPWLLRYTALTTLAMLSRGLLGLLEARVELAPANGRCPICGRELDDYTCPLCGKTWPRPGST